MPSVLMNTFVYCMKYKIRKVCLSLHVVETVSFPVELVGKRSRAYTILWTCSIYM